MGLNCRQIHDYIGLPLLPIVQEIGLRGLPIDQERQANMLMVLIGRLAILDALLEKEGIFDANSNLKLAFQLRERGVPLTERTAGGKQYKVDAEVLGKKNWEWNTKREAAGKAPRFPFLIPLLQRAKLSKARENIQSLGVCDDGLLRTALKSCHTKTARYASSGFGRKNKPGFCPVCRTWGAHGANLQNISRGCSVCGSPPFNCGCDGEGIHIKSLFTAWPGWRLGEWDYAALELRVMAYRIRCDKLIQRLENGVDLHTLHANLMFPDLEITVRRRTLAKNFIYAVRGGGGNRAVQQVLAKQGEYIELSEIEGWRCAIFAEYPEIPAWITETNNLLQLQRTTGERRVLYNAFGRPRVFLGYDPLKEALAFEISSTAADIMNYVAIRLAYEQPEVMQYVAMQIHDSFLIHAPAGDFNETMRSVQQEMERTVWHWGRAVSYPVEAKVGDRWSHLTSWSEVA